jgi:hypothetical protein
MSSPASLTVADVSGGAIVELVVAEEASLAPCVPLERPRIIPHVGFEGERRVLE